MRLRLHVVPGSRRTVVGGRHDDALVVRVTERAVDGKATEAALRAVADELGVGRADVSLVSGATSRNKWIRFDVTDEAGLGQRVRSLLDNTGS